MNSQLAEYRRRQTQRFLDQEQEEEAREQQYLSELKQSQEQEEQAQRDKETLAKQKSKELAEKLLQSGFWANHNSQPGSQPSQEEYERERAAETKPLIQKSCSDLSSRGCSSDKRPSEQNFRSYGGLANSRDQCMDDLEMAR